MLQSNNQEDIEFLLGEILCEFDESEALSIINTIEDGSHQASLVDNEQPGTSNQKTKSTFRGGSSADTRRTHGESSFGFRFGRGGNNDHPSIADNEEQLFGPCDQSMGGRTYVKDSIADPVADAINVNTREPIRTETSHSGDSWMYEEGTKGPMSGHQQSRTFKEAVGRTISRIPLKRRIVHDIVRGPNTGGSHKIHIPDAQCRTAGFNFCLVFSHGADHFHIVHDCSYSTDRCRCARLREALRHRFIGRRRIIWGRDFGAQHVENLISYGEKDPRQIDYLECGGVVWVRGGKARHNAVSEVCHYGQERLVASPDASHSIRDFLQCGPRLSSSTRDTQDHESTHDVHRGQEEGRKRPSFEVWLKNHVSSPLQYIFQTTYFLESKFRYWQLNKTSIQIPLKQINAKIQDMSIVELEMYARNAETCIYNAPLGNVPEHYFSVEESFDVINKLLIYQYKNNREEIVSFLRTLTNIVNRDNGKQNTLICISQPSAGKNYFFDMVLHFCISVGYICNFNKYVTFPLQDCANRRILCWNEPNCEPGSWDTIKMLFGGDNCPIRVKYADDQQVTKTPIIVLTNKDIFPKDEAFRCRVVKIYWTPCNLLRHYRNKPHPLCFPMLLRHYKCMLPLIDLQNVDSMVCSDIEDEYYNSDDSF